MVVTLHPRSMQRRSLGSVGKTLIQESETFTLCNGGNVISFTNPGSGLLEAGELGSIQSISVPTKLFQHEDGPSLQARSCTFRMLR